MRVLIAALFALSLFASEPVDPAEAKTLTKALVSLQAARLAVVDATKRADAAMDAYVKALQSAAAKRPNCRPQLSDEDLEWSWACSEKKSEAKKE
mgnify:CR=1 FL=1